MPALHAVIMAGGSGTRFWPASRTARPKHFLPLVDGRSLLAETIDRAAAAVGYERVWIITNPVQAQRMAAVLEDFPDERLLVEPQARDTAPCVALAMAWLAAREPDAIMAMMPADHVIRPPEAFAGMLERAAGIAADGETLVTFGIKPTRPATGYGYIERGQRLDDRQPPAFRVERFREKPEREVAAELVAAGTHLWNSGIFVWSVGALRRAMAAGNPDLARAADRMLEAARTGDDGELQDAFQAAPALSIDYAVMETAPAVAVVEADLDWHDLGSFLTLAAVAPADAGGNVQVLGTGARALLEQSSGCTVYAEGRRAIALLGAEDLVVVAVDDAVLVCPKERADDLKQLVVRLREAGMEDLL